MTPRILLHLDLNSYFASVEQQANPFLRGKPVGVVATMTANGCIIASSIEAKAKGIKTGVRVKEARAIDPNIILIPNDASKYRTVTAGFMSILQQYTEDIELYSIDEAFLNLTGFVRDLHQAAAMSEEIRQRIQDEVGEWLRCSIGIAPTRWLAKFAGDTAPKGQTLIIEPNNFAQTIDPRPLTNAWGIGERMASHLHSLGLETLGDLRQYPVGNLLEVLGLIGYELWANVNGLELPGLTIARQPKSIGHSHVFAKRATDIAYPRAITAKLCEKVGRRLRGLGLEAHGFYLSYGLASSAAEYWRGGGGGGGRKLPYPLIDTHDIFRHCWEMLLHDLAPGQLPNFLAVGVFNLKPRVDQLELWSYLPQEKNGATPRTGVERLVRGWPRGKHDPPALAQALDTINDRYGDFTVSRGNFWGLDDRDAPDRIGFRKTVGLDDPSQWSAIR